MNTDRLLRNQLLTRRALLAAGGALGVATTLGACSSSDPLAGPSSVTSDPDTIVISCQQYYSNEIIAELYAQSLEKAGFKIKRDYQIGQREVYLPEMEAGRIDVIPEYSGNLLQYFDNGNPATSPEEIETALAAVLPEGIRILASAEATDQDSYTVTRAMSEQHQLSEIGDLAKLGRTIKVGANSEAATRPYGAEGLKALYGVEAEFIGIEDSGGPLTVEALVRGDVDAADIYTASPAILKNDLIVLTDPKNMILAQRVIPLVSAKVDQSAAEAIAKVNAALSADELKMLNARSVDTGQASSAIATEWLTAQGLN